MTHIFWPLDLTVNSWAKNFMKEKYAVWYASQITVGLEKGLAIDEIGPEGLQLYKKETPRTFSSICATSCFVWRHKTQYIQQNKCGFLLKWRKKKKKLVAYATFCFLWRYARQYRKYTVIHSN